MNENTGIKGSLVVEVHDRDGNLKGRQEINNLVTQAGDQFYGDRAANIGTIPTVKGMQLGTGTTAAAKTGAGAAVVTFISGSNVALDGGYPTSTLEAGKRRIQWRCTWAAGTATNSAISEVVLGNPSSLGTAAWTAANVVARAVISPAINKLAADTLTITWNHDLMGA